MSGRVKERNEMITVKEISFQYGKENPILENISFSAKAGESLAILGNNGAGKSTLLKCMNRILMPQQGRVLVDGQNIYQMPLHQVAQNLAFVEQKIPNSRLKVYDVVMLGRKPYIKWGIQKQDEEIVQAVLQQMDLQKMAVRYFDELSGGEQQKIMIARALAQQPKVLLLDEPTSSLDLRNQYEVLQLVRDIGRENQIAVVMVIHDLNLALRYCDKFLLMKDGRIYEYGSQEIITEQSIAEVYQVKVKIGILDGEKVILPCSHKI